MIRLHFRIIRKYHAIRGRLEPPGQPSTAVGKLDRKLKHGFNEGNRRIDCTKTID